jgi:hypothetical protein
MAQTGISVSLQAVFSGENELFGGFDHVSASFIDMIWCSVRGLQRRGLGAGEFDALPWQAVGVEVGHEASGSCCSMFQTPGLRQLPASICLAPIMAGTPVV